MFMAILNDTYSEVKEEVEERREEFQVIWLLLIGMEKYLNDFVIYTK